MPEAFTTFFRAIFAYLLVLIVARLLGRKSISQMTFFDFVVAITLGSLTANLGIGKNNTPVNATIVILTFCAMGILTSFWVLASMKARKLIDSETLVLIGKGELVKANLRRARLSLNRLTMLLRDNNASSMSNARFWKSMENRPS